MTECNKLCDHCGFALPPRSGRRMMHEECKALTVNLPRRCKKCHKVKPAGAFSRDASRAEGRFPHCVECQVSSQSKFQNDADPLNGHVCPVDDVPIRGHRNRRFCSMSCKDKVASLRTKYGLTIQEYRRLIEATHGICPICRQRPTAWQVDHNHKTLLVTGVVCINCNVGLLAYSGHDTAIIDRLLAYLRKTPAEQLGIQAFAPDQPNMSQISPSKRSTWYGNRYATRAGSA